MREIRTSDSTRGRLAADSSLLSVLPYPDFRNGAGGRAARDKRH